MSSPAIRRRGVDPVARVRVRVTGVVQGVGFRPHVHGLAARLGLTGWVSNDTHGVLIEVEGRGSAVEKFVTAVRRDAPPLAVIRSIVREDVPVQGDEGFRIEPSDPGGDMRTLVTPDAATCDACLADLAGPDGRRAGYAFVNCTNCGPRFTIVRDIPYDRANTTMAEFSMCAACADEYADPSDRRFHAEPVCCRDCGPTLALRLADGRPVDGDPIGEAAKLLRTGGIVAVKSLGGYHLAALAGDEHAVQTLRRRKHREDRPFAVMVRDLAAASRLCEIRPAAARHLESVARPIVIIPRREDAPVAPSVAPGHHTLGIMLPSTPLHHLLLQACDAPLVMTSGNVSDEPIAHLDDEARDRLQGIADALLLHDRRIHTRVDDSVLRIVGGDAQPVRRSRGYVPAPLRLPVVARQPILACGAELKNTFALARGDEVFVSHHIGDLKNYETYRAFVEGVAHFERLFEIRPEVVAHDLHPDYLSTRHALDLEDVTLVGVQHHHAHIASCLVDQGVTGPVIGVAFDGLGYGTDGTLWGGEFLVADLTSFERVGHLAPVPMPGGTAAIREPWRMAAAHLDRLGLADSPTPVAARQRDGWDQVVALGRAGLNAPMTSSMGRLFDAVAAVLGLRDEVTYEGQAAVDLEQAADAGERGSYPVEFGDGAPFQAHGSGLVAAAADDLARGVAVGTIAARFHQAVADLVVAGCTRVQGTTGLDRVALSGGVFQNALLVELLLPMLRDLGFTVLVHRQVPPNDGGVSLGQVAVAAHATARER